MLRTGTAQSTESLVHSCQTTVNDVTSQKTAIWILPP